MSSSTIQICVIGSSFVKRLDDYTRQTFGAEKRKNLGLTNSVRVRVLGRPGFNVADFERSFLPALLRDLPDVVICHAGGNDLAKRSSADVAADIHAFGSLLTQKHGVKHFVICSTLMRYSKNNRGTLKFEISESDYQQKAGTLNTRLRSTMFVGSRLHFWELNSLSGKLIGPAAISRDGVHLNQRAMKKYYREMRGAVLKFAGLVRADRE